MRQWLRKLFVQAEATPNENAIKFIPGVPVMKSGVFEAVGPKDARHPLLRSLFGIDGVSSVFLGPDFISVNKTEDSLWKHIKPEVFSVISNYFSQPEGYPIDIIPEEQPQTGDDNELVQMIKELIETRIRPVIQGDGGDIQYMGFDDGYVKLKLQGACRTCAMSSATLKQGIENMLMHYIPEIKGVEQVEEEWESVGNKVFEETENKLFK